LVLLPAQLTGPVSRRTVFVRSFKGLPHLGEIDCRQTKSALALTGLVKQAAAFSFFHPASFPGAQNTRFFGLSKIGQPIPV
jgi:hypothetical protein